MKTNIRSGVNTEDFCKFTYPLASVLRQFSLGREEKPRFSVLLILFHETIYTIGTKSSGYTPWNRQLKTLPVA